MNEAEDGIPTRPQRHFRTRGYQQELLQESLHRNIIIALDTGAGKTHIAVLRMKLEVEQNTKKNCWFIAPTVALIEQQCAVISSSIPVPVGLVSGQSEPDQWKDAKVWRKLLDDHRIIVTTPQILLDALRHGFVFLGDIGLLVFDEAHHATSKHPYNAIMREFYFELPPRNSNTDIAVGVRPMILGLTASPIYGGNIEKAFHELEHNLDSVILSSRFNRDELAQHVHRPIFKHIFWDIPDYSYEEIPWTGPAANVIALNAVYRRLNINEDPYVISLRKQLEKNPSTRLDQLLSKTIHKADTFTHKGIKDFLRAAIDICWELGPWAADWYVEAVIKQARNVVTVKNMIMSTWQEEEKQYLLDALAQVNLIQLPTDAQTIVSRASAKVRKLLHCLVEEESLARADNEPYSGIVFVQRRDSVLAIGELLSRLPETAEIFRIGCLLGSSTSSKRHSFLDITRVMVQDPAKLLADFRAGEKNLIVSTSVAEEGIDIQACGSVIRFDPPPNMVAWAQSRGRARRKKSTFILFDDSQDANKKIQKWQMMEDEMVARYKDQNRAPPENSEKSEDIEDDVEYRVPSTGAVLTLDGVIGHLYHFCSILSSTGHNNYAPEFEMDPPDYPLEWHSYQDRSIVGDSGPWKATCILPRALPPHLRRFKTEKAYKTKRSARCHAAFIAYIRLYEEGLLSDNLLPLWSAIEGDTHAEVELLIKEVSQRASTANVSIQMDPFALSPATVENWRCYKLKFGDEHALHMLTPFQVSSFSPDDLPFLYVPGKKPLKVSLSADTTFTITHDVLATAKTYTYRIFFPVYGSRMKGDGDDIVHLFLPTSDKSGGRVWADRREWQASRVDHGPYESAIQANARILGEKSNYSTDLSIIRDNEKITKLLSFIGWHDGPLSKEEEEELMARYEGYPDAKITFPILVVQAFPRRMNFSIPLESEDAGQSKEDPYLLLPEYATADLISYAENEISLLIPSFLRWLSKAMTTHSLLDNLSTGPSLRSIPIDLLMTAITAPASQERTNYQRLETLGDTVLKYTISIQLFATYPHWHEGYLSRRKDHAVNNSQLAKEAVGKKLYRFIIRDQFVPRKWRPRYIDDKVVVDTNNQQDSLAQEDDETGDLSTVRESSSIAIVDGDNPPERGGKLEAKKQESKRKKIKEELSTKVLADVVEALIGAAYEHGGFDLAIKCITVFGLGITSWEPISSRVQSVLSRVEGLDDTPAQLGLVEQMIDYKFNRKMLLIEALTHSTYQGDFTNMSYERLEFLGDSALDMVVTDYLYHASGKNYSPGHMHIRKEALVNSHLLAFLCMNTSLVIDTIIPSWNVSDGMTFTEDGQKVYLYRCLLHSSSLVLDEQHVTFTRYQKAASAIKQSLDSGKVYPWAALTSLQAPKFISDMIESILGAVFLDSMGNLDAVRHVLTKLGHTKLMERIVREEVDVLHPISRIAIWAAKPDPRRELDIRVEKIQGQISCTILVDEKEIAKASERYRGKASRNHVRFAAAQEVITKMKIIEDEKPEDIDEVGWPDEIPDYEW